MALKTQMCRRAGNTVSIPVFEVFPSRWVQCCVPHLWRAKAPALTLCPCLRVLGSLIPAPQLCRLCQSPAMSATGRE